MSVPPVVTLKIYVFIYVFKHVIRNASVINYLTDWTDRFSTLKQLHLQNHSGDKMSPVCLIL